MLECSNSFTFCALPSKTKMSNVMSVTWQDDQPKTKSAFNPNQTKQVHFKLQLPALSRNITNLCYRMLFVITLWAKPKPVLSQHTQFSHSLFDVIVRHLCHWFWYHNSNSCKSNNSKFNEIARSIVSNVLAMSDERLKETERKRQRPGKAINAFNVIIIVILIPSGGNNKQFSSKW